ncbi:hypothetical protein A9Q84_16720 [Halobacteriovorax marinus]|uniref:Secreted protein n=1 Tax=Halobacteriovorax marinus TaxID=97084 RepID=A0A1Y5F4H2_9BACT|nr:hypothetical protein A9Q84_16720 [Halobacteriovorax marinus]
MKYLTLLVLALSFNISASEEPNCRPDFPYADGSSFVEYTTPGETCVSDEGKEVENRTDRTLLCFSSFAYAAGQGQPGFDEVSLHDTKTCKYVRQPRN